MPVFNLALQFDNKGALTAVQQLGKVSDSAGKAKQAVSGVGSGASQAATPFLSLGRQGKQAGSDISAAMKGASQSLLSTQTVIKRVKKTLGTLGVGVSIKQTLSDFSAYQSALTDMGKVTDQSFSVIDQKIRSLSPELGSATHLCRVITRPFGGCDGAS